MRKLQFKFQWVGPAAQNLATPGPDARPAAHSTVPAAPRTTSREQASIRQGRYTGTRAYALRAASRASIEA